MTTPIFRSSVTPMNSRIPESAPINETPTQRLATILLGQDVRVFVLERRDAGRPWRLIARDLYNATGGQVDVTYETLRQWHGDAAA